MTRRRCSSRRCLTVRDKGGEFAISKAEWKWARPNEKMYEKVGIGPAEVTRFALVVRKGRTGDVAEEDFIPELIIESVNGGSIARDCPWLLGPSPNPDCV